MTGRPYLVRVIGFGLRKQPRGMDVVGIIEKGAAFGLGDDQWPYRQTAHAVSHISENHDSSRHRRTGSSPGKTITTYVVFEAAAQLAAIADGEVLEFITDDYEPIRNDIPAWCEAAGHRLLSTESTPRGLRFQVEKGPIKETQRQFGGGDLIRWGRRVAVAPRFRSRRRSGTHGGAPLRSRARGEGAHPGLSTQTARLGPPLSADSLPPG